MRELSFRAWLKNIKKMTDVTWFTDKEVNCNYIPLPNRDDVILMQFTGLFDKNGTKIYEGDILRWNDEKDGYALAWNETDCCYSFGDWDLCDDGSIDILEVIGNIYEEV